MSERKNIKLPAELFDRLEADKRQYESWPAYFERECLGNSPKENLNDP